jgi:hypothetical protein
MEGKKANRKPEPVAVPIYGDMAKFWTYNRGKASTFLPGRDAH